MSNIQFWIFMYLMFMITVSSIFTFKIWRTHRDYCKLLEDASDIISQLQRYEKKLSIMVYNFESRHDRLFQEDKKQD